MMRLMRLEPVLHKRLVCGVKIQHIQLHDSVQSIHRALSPPSLSVGRDHRWDLNKAAYILTKSLVFFSIVEEQKN